MIITREDALDILRKWFEEGSVIRLQGAFPTFAFGWWGRIVSLNPSELRIMADAPDKEFVLRLDSEILQFGYGDDRIVTGEEKKFSDCVVVLVGAVPDTGPVDTIVLAALKP